MANLSSSSSFRGFSLPRRRFPGTRSRNNQTQIQTATSTSRAGGPDAYLCRPSLCAILFLGLFNVVLLLVLFQAWYWGLLEIATSTWNMDHNPQPLNNNPQALSSFPKVRRRPNGNVNVTKTPLLVVGLPKAGTSSLFEFFHCHGLYSQHWYCCGKQTRAQKGGPHYMSDCLLNNLQHGLPILDGCGDYDVYTELNGPRRERTRITNSSGTLDTKRPRIFLPQYYHLQELHDYAPSSTWILNLRPVDDWINSVLRMDGNMLTRQLINEVQIQTISQNANNNNNVLSITTPKGRTATQAFLRAFWHRHVDQVTMFVQAHPSHTLVVVNITDPNAGVHLSRALGWTNASANASTTTPSRARACWGQHNVAEPAY